MSATLYEVLGVRKDSSLASIKNGYRKKALEHHPDRGGDAEKFRQAQLAFDVLSDPERRKRYDETGQFDSGADQTATHVLRMMFQAIAGVAQQLYSQGVKPTTRDMVRLAGEALKGDRKQAQKQLKTLEESKAAWAELAERIETTDGNNNPLREIVAGQRLFADQQIAEISRKVEVIDKALEELKRYRFRMDQPKGFAATSATATIMWTSV